MNHPKPSDRRKFSRFSLKEGATAALTPFDDESHYTLMGRIVDISSGGLAFEYEGKADPDSGFGILDIFGLVKPHFHLVRVPFRVVYHQEVFAGNGSDAGRKRWALAFGKLSENQVSQLDALMESYALHSPDQTH